MSVFKDRIECLERIRADPGSMPLLRKFYRDNPAEFISDWGITLNAKNVERGLPSLVPFLLYPKQADWVRWVVDHWRNQKPGITEKTRQMGFSWLSMATACTLCLFNEGMVVGVGSRKEAYVDILGDPKSLLQKAREFMRHLPEEFRGGWDIKSHAPHMRLTFPSTGAIITGEVGDNIGRGNTTSIYFVDESAFLARPDLVDAALSQTTNCRIDISTPNGMGNPFAQKRFSGNFDVFSFHWLDDPTKDDDWYQKQVAELNPVVVAAEIDINYSASVEGVLIPSAWVQAAIGAHEKLEIKPTGARTGALDVADEGKDKNAFCVAHGVVVQALDEWSGKGDDIFGTVQKAFALSDEHRLAGFKYDADGLGAGVRGDARVINEGRKAADVRVLSVTAFRGSASVFNPEGEDVKGRKNQDFFMNAKAQAWWSLRARFQRTYRAVVEGAEVKPDDIISLDPSLPCLSRLCGELSQPTYSVNAVGKIVVDKSPEGMRSPNLADAVMMQFAKVARGPMQISADALAAI